MKSQRELSRFIGTIYDTIFKPELWSVILEQVCSELNAKAASVHMVDPVKGKVSLFVEHGTDPAWTALLLSKYATMSPIGAAVLLADLDEPVSAFDFVDEEEFVASRFYKEWCEPQGYHDMLGALIAKRPTEVGAISATRSHEAGRFDAGARQYMGNLAPHVRRAVTISGLLEQRSVERSHLASVIDQLSVAMILLSRSLGIIKTNRSGSVLLDAGAVATSSGGHLSMTDEPSQSALSRALSGEGTEPALIPVRGSDGRAYLAALLPVDLKSGVFALLINPQEDDIPPVGKHLAALFGLTPREISVLMPLLEGSTIDEVAGRLGISADTARTHLKRLMTKTGTSRQLDLVQKVMQALPPVRMTGGY
jgi:DNA-binding CsgD family transcriptional regulator